ncbi:MAG: signal peptidase II [Nanoarchaeota archaeon]|nr:signal peptidase II [Nanoarchaeota archaeon]MBU1631613.1 signal peptidase II [Nanoarchaeota archaeon]MBU1876634.1 signal peptidase II [Nanoarchaeota archaeon]
MVKQIYYFKKYNQEIFFTFVSSLIVFFDQLTKYLVSSLKLQLDLKLLTIHFVKNTGAGFGILKNQTSILTFISSAIAFVLIIMYKKIPKEKTSQTLFAIFLGGVVGNLIDRFFLGYVIDFIDFNFWPAFNIADAAISISVIGLIIYFWKR